MDQKELLEKLDKRISELSLLDPDVLCAAIKRMQEKHNMNTFSSAVEDMLLSSYWEKYKRQMDETMKKLNINN